MGAHDFHDQNVGVTAGEAYKAAVDDAHYEYGHDAYNGTISTTSGFVLIPLNEDETLDNWAGRVIEDDRVQKWENCACVADPDHPIDDELWRDESGTELQLGH